MRAHIRTALTTVNLSVPVSGRQLCLGTWQGIYVWEHRRTPHTRSVVVHIIGDEA
jgi:secondary thiamine-phosphate synthase enzyme